jgi:hypothetical protein
MIKVIQTCGRLSIGLVDRGNALLREVELYPRRSSILAVCRSDVGGNVPLDRLSHRASRSGTARAKITARTHKCAGADDLPESALRRKRPSATAAEHA